MLLLRKKLVFVCLLCLTFSVSRASSIDSLLKKHKQTKTSISIFAVEADSGHVLYRRHADRPMTPASNMKLITSSAALHYLGSDYAFQTKIGTLGKDLVVIGGGDPLLGDPKNDTFPCQAVDAIMDTIVNVLQNADVSKVNNVIIDTSFFDDQRVHLSWPVDQLNKWYACEISGLNFYNNCIHLQVSRSGGSARFTMLPPNNYVHLVNQLRLISKGSSAVGAYRNSVPNKLIVKGNLNQEAGFDVAIENPAGLFASILMDKLKSSGISVEGTFIQKRIEQSEIKYLLIFKTPIADVLKRCNTNSLGLAAECLVKTISAENKQEKATGQWPHGLQLISKYLNSLNIRTKEFVLDDGSGLSDKNRITAESLVAVLKDMYSGQSSEVFLASLAVGGEDGTIQKYFHDSPYKGNIIGKTGYIKGVRSFSGVCRTPKGDILFSILTENGNGYTRRCINDITKAIFDRQL